MLSRNSIITLALWALFLAPLLCGSGFLTHSCLCDDSNECRHELQCSTDPCQILALGSTSHNNRSGYSNLPVDQLNPPALVDDDVLLPNAGYTLVPDPAGILPETVVPDRCLPLLC